MVKGDVKTISLDFDGVIHAYSKGWHDGTIYDGPVSGAIDAMKILREKGYKLIISTARKDLIAVEEWLEKYDISGVEVTNLKPKAVAYIDDRSIKFISWEDTLNNFEDKIKKHINN